MILRRSVTTHNSAFTLIELLAAVAIIAVLVASMVVFIPSFLTWAQKTTNEHNLAILNSALQEYKTLGGMSLGHSLEGANTEDKMAAVLTRLKSGVTVGGYLRSFLKDGADKIETAKLYATGSGRQFYFSGYGVATAGVANSAFAGAYSMRPAWIAVYDGTYYTSSNGTTWSSASLPGSAYNWSIAQGNGVIVAAGNTNFSTVSTDGTAWSGYTTMPTAAGWNGYCGLAFGNGVFVAVSNYNHKVAYSNDGATWTDTGQSINGFRIHFGNGKFWLYKDNQTSNSSDGASWSHQSWPPAGCTNVTNASCFGGGKFVMIGNDGDVVTSSDAVTWSNTQSALPASNDWSGLTYGNGKYVAVRHNSNMAAYSSDGVTWTTTTLPASGYWSAVAYGNGKFIATGGQGAQSTDGINWTAIPSGPVGSAIIYVQ